jgi:hypothetical protein
MLKFSNSMLLMLHNCRLKRCLLHCCRQYRHHVTGPPKDDVYPLGEGCNGRAAAVHIAKS